MEQITITGKVLLRHGFRYNAYRDYGYSLVLPMAEGKFLLDWDSTTGLYLCLRNDNANAEVEEGREANPSLHRLDHILTLESLKLLYQGITGQPLMELSETDSGYQRELQELYKVHEEADNPGTYEFLYFEGDPTLNLLDGSVTGISPEALKEEGFVYRNNRYETTINYEGDNSSDLT